MENQKVIPSGLSLKLAFSAGMLAILLLLAVFTDSLLQQELFKALAVVACLNVFRIISNHHLPIEK